MKSYPHMKPGGVPYTEDELQKISREWDNWQTNIKRLESESVGKNLNRIRIAIEDISRTIKEALNE